MIFRQFFDSISSTYTYLVSSGYGREALIIDPVLEKTGKVYLCGCKQTSNQPFCDGSHMNI